MYTYKYIFIYIYVYIGIHKYVCTHMHENTRTQTHINPHTQRSSHTNTQRTPQPAQSQTRKPAWIHPYVQTCKYTHARIHTCIKTPIHTCTHPSIRESNGPADEGAEERPDHRTQRTGYYNPLCPSPRTLALCLDDVVSLSHQSACFFCHHCRIRTDNEHNCCHARHDEYALGAARAVKHIFVSFHHGRRPGGVKHISGSFQSPDTASASKT